jgi:Protoglobin
MASQHIPGYGLGQRGTAVSPLDESDLELLKTTLLISEGDLQALRMAGEVLDDQVDDVLDVWYGFVGSHPHLLRYFHGANQQPDAAYLAAVRLRFGQWIRDTCAARYDRAWLDYQEEIGLRHTRAAKNRTDGVQAEVPLIHLRYLLAFVVPLTLTIRPFLSRKGHGAEAVDRMAQAWFKAVTLTAVLWARPYVPADNF